MAYLYTVLGWTACLGGHVWCLYSIAFRWQAVTHRYGRMDLWIWLLYASFVAAVLSIAGIIGLYELEQVLVPDPSG